MSINADISELGDMMEGIAPLEEEEKPMTGKEFISAYQLDEAEKKTEVRLVKYTKEELLKFRQSPLAMGKPELNDPVLYSMSCWSKATQDELIKRRSGVDPRERTRREGDGIILSPQRGNFNNGCAVAPQRVQQPSHRRIGSGRLLKRDWDGDESLIFRSSHNRDEWSNGMPDGTEMRSGRHGQRYETKSSAATPEWFTCGPTSQDETIDLHGFDYDEEEDEKVMDNMTKGEDENPIPDNASIPSSSPSLNQQDETPAVINIKNVQTNEHLATEQANPTEDSDDFNIDDLLQNDDLCPLFEDMHEQVASNSSRFSQFFSSSGEEVAGAVPIHDHQIKPVINNGQSYSGVALLDLFRHEQQRQSSGPSLKDLAATGKVTDVAEIEAGYRQSALAAKVDEEENDVQDINPEVQAFIFKRAKQQETSQRSDPNFLFTMQLQQQLADRNQALLLGKFMVPPLFQQLPPELQSLIANAKPTVEICTTPEFTNILTGLHQGRITVPNIVGQLMSTLDVRLQEILIAVLNMTLVNRDPFILQQMVVQNGLQQQQALRAHTSSIMQTALLRKKLEEQAENFKKREILRTEMNSSGSRGTSPIPHGNTLSFTPTAVLRKMTADDKDGLRNVRAMEGAHSPTQPRSPIPPHMSSEGPLSPSFTSVVPQWGPPLRAITKTCDYDPATGRNNWMAPAQGSPPVNFPYRPPMNQRVAPSPNRPRFSFPPPMNRLPPQFQGPVSQGRVSPMMGNNATPPDEFRPLWTADPYDHPHPPPQGRIISVEELERKTRMQRF